MIKVMLVDDEPQICMILEKIIEKQADYQVVAKCQDFATALVNFRKHSPDVVFMDIDLGGDDGMECAKIMTELSPKVKIIFATAHSEYMANAFEIYAFDYLVKPFDMERVVRTLDRIRDQQGAAQMPDAVSRSEKYQGKLLIKGKEQSWLVSVEDIIFIEKADGSTRIVTKSEEYKTALSLTDLEEKLDKEQFIRCHKSYIVNVSQITRMESYGRWTYTVKLKDTKETALMTSQHYEEIKNRFS
ncbi:MAG: response regulator transcription factor [Lachnospiraceae bacterium]|nr:response regulator transcription factor [Lachnospiraceae bacterium]